MGNNTKVCQRPEASEAENVFMWQRKCVWRSSVNVKFLHYHFLLVINGQTLKIGNTVSDLYSTIWKIYYIYGNEQSPAKVFIAQTNQLKPSKYFSEKPVKQIFCCCIQKKNKNFGSKNFQFNKS